MYSCGKSEHILSNNKFVQVHECFFGRSAEPGLISARSINRLLTFSAHFRLSSTTFANLQLHYSSSDVQLPCILLNLELSLITSSIEYLGIKIIFTLVQFASGSDLQYTISNKWSACYSITYDKNFCHRRFSIGQY